MNSKNSPMVENELTVEKELASVVHDVIEVLTDDLGVSEQEAKQKGFEAALQLVTQSLLFKDKSEKEQISVALRIVRLALGPKEERLGTGIKRNDLTHPPGSDNQT